MEHMGGQPRLVIAKNKTRNVFRQTRAALDDVEDGKIRYDHWEREARRAEEKLLGTITLRSSDAGEKSERRGASKPSGLFLSLAGLLQRQRFSTRLLRTWC